MASGALRKIDHGESCGCSESHKQSLVLGDNPCLLTQFHPVNSPPRNSRSFATPELLVLQMIYTTLRVHGGWSPGSISLLPAITILQI